MPVGPAEPRAIGAVATLHAERWRARDRGPLAVADTAAGDFYARLGGAVVEDLVKDEPDGSRPPVRRIAWNPRAAFAAGAA